MNKRLLDKEKQAFIHKHVDSNPESLLFKKPFFDDVSNAELVEQIASKQKCKTKLVTWFHAQGIYYPPKLNLEQTSSEATALFKSKLVSGNRLIDITGGFGIDSYYFGKQFDHVVHCELNSELSEIVKHNLQALEVGNIECISGDGLQIVSELNKPIDCIYIDPSRRSDSKGKVFLLSDCLPNVPEHLDVLYNTSDTILIKVSPLLDISNGIKELHGVKEVIVVAVKNEVKELLFLLNKGYDEAITIRAINLIQDNIESFSFEYKTTTEATYALPERYLYEPNAAILKSGGFDNVSSQIQVAKLHQHSHLYTSTTLLPFPGRRFEILEVLPFNRKTIKKQFSGTKANITTRNFPKAVALLRKELQIKDGGDYYLFFTTNLDNEKIVVVCKKV